MLVQRCILQEEQKRSRELQALERRLSNTEAGQIAEFRAAKVTQRVPNILKTNSSVPAEHFPKSSKCRARGGCQSSKLCRPGPTQRLQVLFRSVLRTSAETFGEPMSLMDAMRWRPSLVGWRPSLLVVGWRPSLLGCLVDESPFCLPIQAGDRPATTSACPQSGHEGTLKHWLVNLPTVCL